MRVLGYFVVAMLCVGPASPVRAQGTPGGQWALGFEHTALGSAGLDFNPAGGVLILNNLGSSGQDGVEIKWPKPSKSMHVGLQSIPPISSPGSSHTFECRGLSAATGSSVTTATIHMTQNSDGSQQVVFDAAAAHATHVWTIVLNAAVAQVSVTLTNSVGTSTVVSGGRLAARAGSTGADHALPALGGIIESDVKCVQESPTYRWFQVDYASDVIFTVPGRGDVAGRSIRFVCDDGDPVDTPEAVRLACAIPAGAGSLRIDSEAARVGCPDCFSLGTDAGECVALGATQFGDDLLHGGLAIGNLGSSGQDGVRIVGNALPGARAASLPAQVVRAIGADLEADGVAAGTMICDATGRVSGTPDQALGQLACAYDAAGVTLQPDFGAVGATGYRVRMRLTLTPSDVTISDPASPPRIDLGVGAALNARIQAELPPGTNVPEFHIICITSPCPGWNVTVDGASYNVSEIVLSPLDPAGGGGLPTAQSLDALSLRGTNATVVTLLNTQITTTATPVAVDPPAKVVELAMSRPSPNPASGAVRVVFALPRSARANVVVADVTGRRVRTLVRGDFAAGAHTLVWDGRDDAGASAAPGVYYVRVEAGGASRTGVVTRLR